MELPSTATSRFPLPVKSPARIMLAVSSVTIGVAASKVPSPLFSNRKKLLGPASGNPRTAMSILPSLLKSPGTAVPLPWAPLVSGRAAEKRPLPSAKTGALCHVQQALAAVPHDSGSAPLISRYEGISIAL